MTLFTRHLLTRFASDHPAIADTRSVAPTRRAIGTRLYDVALLVPPHGGRTMRTARRDGHVLAHLLATMRLRATVHEVPPERSSALPDEMISAVKESLSVLVMCEETVVVGSAWLWWVLGGCEARRQHVAVLPVARRNRFRPMWQLAAPLAALPYLGLARAVGDREESMWVMPAGEPLESNEAVNFEYWLHEHHWRLN